MKRGGLIMKKWTDMDYLDKAFHYKKILEEEGLTAYEYNRVSGLNIIMHTRFLNLSDRVLKRLRESGLNMDKASKLLKLRKSKSDDVIIKIIDFIEHKDLDKYDVNKLVEYELNKVRV